jgi:metal-sulfur cluster biosynthetic enzyme
LPTVVQIKEALKGVLLPEPKRSILELNMVRNVEVAEAHSGPHRFERSGKGVCSGKGARRY